MGIAKANTAVILRRYAQIAVTMLRPSAVISEKPDLPKSDRSAAAPLDVVVVTNGSTDESRSFLRVW